MARYAALALAIVLGVLAIRRDGAKDALRDARDRDHEKADAMRRAVERDLDQRVRDYKDRGFRDK
jgi:hypothetical protein